MSRYDRHIILNEIGQAGQDKLSRAKVLVIGAGGLGCPVLQYLTAAGIGTIGIVDFDVVEESNLQRQVLFGTSSLGTNKAIAAKERLTDLNDTIEIIAYPIQLTAKNAIELFQKYDLVIDGSDNFQTRYLINDAAILTNIPVVYGAIYKFEGQVSVFNFNDGPSYRCLFPKPPKEGSVANCSEIGVLGVLPGIIGSMQANEVLKIILGFNGVLSGKMCCYNAKKGETTTLIVPRSDSEINKVLTHVGFLPDIEQNSSCENKAEEVSVKEVLEMNNIQFLDVRNMGEKPTIELSNTIQIPLTELEDNLHTIDPEKITVAICQTGIRSLTAVRLLQKHSISNCYSLEGGVFEMIKHINIKTS